MSLYENKQIFVTGGTGFIGSRLAERLALEEKANVNVLVNSWSKATWISRSNVNLIQGNINDYENLEKALAGNEIVFHCVGVGGSLENCLKVNLEGTKNVLKACLKNGVKRIVYFSSVVVHGASISENMDETAAFKKTGNAYADSKIEAEIYFSTFIKENKIEGVIIRPTFVWGAVSPYYTIDVVQQMKAKNFMLVDNGEGACNAVHVDNLVDLALVCGFHEGAKNETFLITDNEKISWKDFWGNYAKMLNIKMSDLSSLPSKPNLSRRMKLKMKKKLLGVRDFLTRLINKSNPKFAFLTKITLKAPRKIIKKQIAYFEKIVPEMDAWDLETFSSRGFISNEKSKKLLNFSPQKTIQIGMEECELWLKDQNYL